MSKQEKDRVEEKSKKKPEESKNSKKRKSEGLFNGLDSTSDFTEAELDFLDAMGF